MIPSKLIIGSDYKELGFTWSFYFHFPEKCVTLGQGFYSKLFCFHVLLKIIFEKPYCTIQTL